MSGPGPHALTRVCPACGRRVAPPSTTCRCGKVVSDVPLTAAPARPMPSPPPDTSGVQAAAKIAVAIVGVVGAGYMIYRASLPPSGASRPTVPKSAAPTGAPASAISRTPPLPSAVQPSADAPPPSADAPADASVAAHEPSALERVLAAAAASKLKENAGGAAPGPEAAVAAASLEDVISRAMPSVVGVET